jgi:signal transduction histidine kinase
MADRASIFLLVTILLFVTILLIFAMKYFSAARQARLRITSEDAYRDLADRSVKAQEESAAALGELKASVAEIDGRLTRVEKVLKEVE